MPDKGATSGAWKFKLPAVLVAAVLMIVVVTLALRDGRLPRSAGIQRVDPSARAAFIVQGRSSDYEAWSRVYQNMVTRPAVDLYFGVYDEPIRNCDVSSGAGGCIFIPNTTWSTGRNTLARIVYRQRQASGQAGYKYWAFMDADSLPIKCAVCEGLEGIHLHSCCWDTYVEYLLMSSVQHAMVGLASYAIQPDFRTESGGLYFGAPFAQLFHDCFDAIIHAVHAQAMPLYMPLFTDLEATSWWESQALEFYLAVGCAPGASIILGGFAFSNDEHKAYPRGRAPVPVEEGVLKKHLPKLSLLFPHLSNDSRGIDQGNCGRLPIEGWQDMEYVLNNHIDSGWWRGSRRYQICMTSFQRRFSQFMEAPTVEGVEKPH